MFSKQVTTTGRLCAAVVAALAVVGCANPGPAPVVNRTNMPLPLPLPDAQPPLANGPGQPLPPGMQAPMQSGQAAGERSFGVQASPIRSGSIESGSMPAGATPIDPNLKTGPKGLKRPYGEVAAVDPGVAGRINTPATTLPSTPSNVAQAPAVVATTAPASVANAPAAAPPPLPAQAGGTGLLEGVAFAWPASGTVLQNFDQTSSKGLWLAGKAGDPVRAAADGRVIFSGSGPRGYGNLLIVKHTNELLSVYAHNRSLSAKEGDSVKRGQKIAELGDSGTDRPKLHFEIRQQGKPIDPLAVLPRR